MYLVSLRTRPGYWPWAFYMWRCTGLTRTHRNQRHRMASFMYFDGRGDEKKVSMSGAKRSRMSHREQMAMLRKQRAVREETRAGEEAAVKLQKWMRGNWSREAARRTFICELEKEQSAGCLRYFAVVSQSQQRNFLPIVVEKVSRDKSFHTAEQIPDPLLYFNRCLKLLAAAVASSSHVQDVLDIVSPPTLTTGYQRPDLHHRLQLRIISLNALSYLTAPPPLPVLMHAILASDAFVAGGFHSFVTNIFARNLHIPAATPTTPAQLLLGFDPGFGLSGPTILDMFREACNQTPAAAQGVLEGFSALLHTLVSKHPELVPNLVSLFGSLLQYASPAWVGKNIQTLAIMQPFFGRKAVAASIGRGDLSQLCGFYSTMLSKCGDNKAKTAVLAVLAFADGFLPALWKEVDDKLQLAPIARSLTYAEGLQQPLYLFIVACGYFLDCSHVNELIAIIDVSSLTVKLINHGTRSIFHDPPSVLIRDATMGLLRKLHDWNCRQPFLSPPHWIVQPPFPWPTKIALDDWRAHHVGSPVYRTFLVLQNIPFIIPFDARVLMFRSLVEEDINSLGMGAWFGGESATIRRNKVFEDGFRAITRMTPDELKMKARVTFISRQGAEEAGFGDGVFKEFLSELSKVAFNPAHGLFLATEANEMYPNPASNEEHLYGEGYLERYRFLGRVLGKALYEGILIDLPLTRFFRNALLDRGNCLHDLSSLDPELHKNLLQLKTMSPEEVDAMGLVFAVTVDKIGITKTVEFFPGGADVAVTDENKMKYIHMMSYFKLTQQISKQVGAMKEGLQEVVSPSWLRMFDANELQILLCGHDNTAPLDIDDWEANTIYGGGYHRDHNTINMFWRVVREQFTPAQQRQLLKFATSVDRAPLLGFKYLHPKFCIHQGGEVDRLPSSSTCMCLLKLPPYANLAQLREKLSTAIQHDTGFELS
eukprot:TRINITY_DN8159_c0_g1_i1.p1 TRINITY_DN8159_c0_g1~~TRINITY_DN8159_c0_g1_i1.p1  ORF type:complete len:935 (+),score=300.80 TRINITY_DN8159_c0_g1_i1:396-3200(+)